MKRLVMMVATVLFCTPFLSFSGKGGGDFFAVFLNGKQVHLQAVHADKSVKTLMLPAGSETDRIEVSYSHCGRPGKNRVLTVRNEKDKLIRKLAFGNGQNDRSLMGFTRKEVAATNGGRLRLYYSSEELPEERLLAVLNWRSSSTVLK